jgi:murein L,D-transpeptidase YcbB/YkuD
VYKDGEIIRSEKIVVGMLDKQSAIFSRPLKFVVLRPEWKVPDSIKVNELWPGLIRHTRVMNAFGIEVQKDGKTLDWHKIDWVKADINAYDFVQPPGPRSVLGHVKFSFPSQHTIYMHDTPDKYMFNSSVRTLSHGCLRVKNPMALAELILKEDKGWDADRIAELNATGPLNNEVPIEKRIEVHVAYYTAWVDADGKLKSFPDIYGHEKRVTQALNGQWEKIDHGKDDQAPVEANFDPRALGSRARGGDVGIADNSGDPFAGSSKGGRASKGLKGGGFGDLLSALFGG